MEPRRLCLVIAPAQAGEKVDTLLRQVRKAGDCRAYETAVRQFFYDAELSH